MPVVTKEQLDQYLEKKPLTQSVSNYTHQSFGPAEMDKWLLFTPDLNCFLNLAEEKPKKTKKKLIFSNYLINLIDYNSLDTAILESLVENYDLYLWPGEDVPFSTLKPVTTFSELWENRHTIHGATKETVLDSLAKQGISTEDNIIVDFNEYESLAQQIQKHELEILDIIGHQEIENTPDRGPNIINFQYLDSKNSESCHQIAKSLQPSLINTIYGLAPTLNDYHFIKKTFPNATTYIPICSNVHPGDQRKCNAVLKNVEYSFKVNKDTSTNQLRRNLNDVEPLLIESKEQWLKLLKTDVSKIKRLKIKEFKWDQDIDLTQFKELIHCTLYDPNPHRIQWAKENKLQSLELSNRCANFESIHQGKLQHLTDLCISGNQYNFKTIPHLKRLIIDSKLDSLINENLEKIDIFTDIKNQSDLDRIPSNVKEITIRNLETDKLDFRRFHQLRRINVDPSTVKFKIAFNDRDKNCILLPSQLEELTLNKNNCSIDFHGANQLRKFSAKESKISQLDVSSCKKLEYLSAYDVNGDFKLNDLTKLKYLSIKGTAQNEFIINLKNAHDLAQLEIRTEKPIHLNLEGCNQLQYLSLVGGELTVQHPQNYSKLRGCNLFCKNANTFLGRIASTCIVASSSPFNRLPLHADNDTSPVSIFSLSDDTDIDNKTNLDPSKPHQASGDFISTLIGKNINKDNYRIRFYDKVEFNNEKLSFKSSLTDKDCVEIKKTILAYDTHKLQQISDQVKQDSTIAAGILSGTLQPGKLYPLPVHCALNENDINEIYCNPSGTVKLFWNKTLQQYYVKCAQETKVEILYQFKVNPAYEKDPTTIPVSETSLLPKSLQDILSKRLKEHAPLKFLFEEISPLEKLRLLKIYCQEFTVNSLNSEVKNSLDNLLACIIEQKGVCRHRSRVFMILAQLVGIPVKIVENELHSYCEVNGHRFDLGGGEVLDVTPANKRKNPFAEVTKQEEKKQEEKETKESKKEFNPYIDNFDRLIKQSQFQSIADVLQHQGSLSPLIELESHQNPLEVRKAFAHTLKEPYIYIHSPQDFKNYLTPYKLENGAIAKSDGPLAALLSQGGVLLVNWSNFTPNELAIYKSILDAKPTLAGRDLKNVKVIGLKTATTAACSAFTSRCQSYTLNNDSLKVETKEVKTTDTKPIVVDLFHHPNWREQLLGKIQYSETIKVEEGPLLQAITQNCPITILNPPEDEGFKLFFKQLQDERRFLYMDQFKKLSDNVTFQIQQKNHEYKNNITINTENKQNRELIYLGAHNIHECFEITVQDEKTHQLTDAAGFLTTYEESNQAFYVTSFISKANWDRIQHAIHENYPNKKFEFILAPGGKIEGIDKTVERPPADEKTPSSIILSTDPDFESLKLQKESKESVLIIDVTPQMGIHDLILKMERKLDAKESISMQQKGMATALLEKKNIILNGEISPLLYQQLMPLLSSSSPHYYLNGKRKSLSNHQLKLVMPSSAKKMVTQNYMERQYASVSDYANQFSTSEQPELKRIAEFYDYANKIPHTGDGLPSEVRLSYQLLKRMLEKLKTGKLHPQNPIKGLFHYSYPKHSKDFNFLNVAAKLCFSQRQESKSQPITIRRQKIEPFLKSPEHFKKHIWEVLNYFNADALFALFPNGLKSVLRLDTASPSLTDEAIKQAWSFIQKEIVKEVKSTPSKPSHIKKRAEQLATLLADINSPLIFLKGEAGVGKSFTVRELKDQLQFDYCEGPDEIEKWLLNTTTGKPKILLLDEVNLEKPGAWDFLKGLGRNHQVYYNGKMYTLTEQHKIIMTGNPESYSGRYHHSLFQDYAETVYFKMPEADFIEKMILNRLLKPANLEKHSRMLLLAYQLAVKSNPTVVYSNRDLESLAQRFCLMVKNNNETDVRQHILDACRIEFAGSFSPLDKRENFISQLQNVLGIDLPAQIEQTTLPSPNSSAEKLFIPDEKYYCIEAIRQDLAICQQALEQKDMGSYKQGVLLEGGAGLGKSTLFEALLIENGFSKDAKETQKKYYVISAGEPTAYEIVEKAFHEGACVILDELNLDKNLEKKLNQLLTGFDTKGNKADKPGFLVLASQNPSFEKGRYGISQALRNRFHMLYMEPYSEKALIQIAMEKPLPEKEAKQFVEAFHQAQLKSPIVNMRTFYTVLNTLPKPQTRLTIS